MVCDAVPRVVAWKLAKADGVRDKSFARAKNLSAVHCAAVRLDPVSLERATRPRYTRSSAISSELVTLLFMVNR